jgi:hypothetical protein
VTTPLRWTWATGVLLLATGLVLSVDGAFVLLYPGLVVLCVTGGITAARGRRVGPWWLACAWSVPVLPLALAGIAFGWLAWMRADPLAVVMLVYVTVGVWVGVLVTFALVLVAELARLLGRRRRFGEARPPWNNDPTPPT